MKTQIQRLKLNMVEWMRPVYMQIRKSMKIDVELIQMDELIQFLY